MCLWTPLAPLSRLFSSFLPRKSSSFLTKLLNATHHPTLIPLQLPASADLEFEPPHHHSIQIDTPKPVPHKINGKKKKKIKEEEDEVEVTRGFKSMKSKIEEHQLPYVHVRARRGQATDSHSLAERARREKINARMKLLQELVPGCSKITGIALVLDEIINHVQALQRQVEFLSMQLSAVNPRVEFNLDHYLNENTSFVSMHPPLEWSEPQANGFRRSFVQQWQCDAYQQSQWPKEENHLESVATVDTTLLRTDYSQEPGSMQPMQLKVEQA